MKVSVCIPTYNQSQYLEQAVLSAYNQSVLPFEIIVSDDCSSDDSQEVLQKLKTTIPVLKVIRHEQNIGMVLNTDFCLRQGTGDFVIGLDSDDYLSGNYIEKLSDVLIQYPDACYAHANIQEIDLHGNFGKLRTLYRKPGFQSGESALYAARKGYRVAANIIMFRRTDLVKLNYFTNRPDYVKDYHFAAASAALGLGNVYLNETLAYYRVWVDNGKARLYRKLNEINGLHKVFTEVLGPAFKAKGWSSYSLEKQRRNFACTQASCLSLSVYTNQEKAELANALTTLSSSPQVKFFIWLYSNGYGNFIEVYGNAMFQIKLNIKKVLLRSKA